MKNSASMEEAESLANFSMLTELDANGATKEDLDNMRGVLQSQVDEKMPWLSDVLGEQLDKLVRVSSSPTHGARSRRLIEPYEKGLHWLLKTQNLITKDLQ